MVSILHYIRLQAYASTQLNADLGFSDSVYGLGSGIFFVGYMVRHFCYLGDPVLDMDSVASKNLTAPSMQVFQIPSQFVAERVGLVRWLSLLLITWGAVATSFAGLTRSHIHLYVPPISAW